MKTKLCLSGFFALTSVCCLAASSNWPQWRGPSATGTSPDADPPTEWSETKNVKWKVPIAGEGDSTPIIWDNRVFILTAVRVPKTAETKSDQPKPKGDNPGDARPEEPKPVELAQAPPPGGPGGPPPGEGKRQRGPGGPGGFGPPGGPGGGRGMGRGEKPTDPYQFTVLCLDRATGKTLWKKVAREEVPHEGRQPDNTFASASPITDGKLVFAYFGSRGLHCYDMDGNLKWSKDFGRMVTRNGFGEGASPALHGDTLIVNWDDEGDGDFIAAFNKQTGDQLWKTPRDEHTGWSTPLIVESGGKAQVVVNASGKVRGYDLATGKEIWSCAGQTANAIPSPVADADTVYVTSGFMGSALYAIKLGASGDVAGTDAVRWKYNRNTPYVPSPLLVDSLIYVVKDKVNILSCFDAKNGNPGFEGERLEGLAGIYASPVSAKDRVYVLDREGKCLVLKKGTKLETLATNKLDDKTDASIALAGKELFIRGKENLYCIAGN